MNVEEMSQVIEIQRKKRFEQMWPEAAAEFNSAKADVDVYVMAVQEALTATDVSSLRRATSALQSFNAPMVLERWFAARCVYQRFLVRGE